jgi:hypothetical protein
LPHKESGAVAALVAARIVVSESLSSALSVGGGLLPHTESGAMAASVAVAMAASVAAELR